MEMKRRRQHVLCKAGAVRDIWGYWVITYERDFPRRIKRANGCLPPTRR